VATKPWTRLELVPSDNYVYSIISTAKCNSKHGTFPIVAAVAAKNPAFIASISIHSRSDQSTMSTTNISIGIGEYHIPYNMLNTPITDTSVILYFLIFPIILYNYFGHNFALFSLFKWSKTPPT
jgi:hypothetical protein